MQRYFLKITAPRDAFNAEGKAPADVENILRQEGFKPLEIRAPRWNDLLGINARLCYQPLEKLLQKAGELFIQYPFYAPHSHLIIRKILHTDLPLTVLVHDLDMLRGGREESEPLLRKARRLIVHTEAMKAFLCKRGFNGENIKVLQCFDYLVEHLPAPKPSFTGGNDIAFAGNLEKSEFLKLLSGNKILSSLHFLLYGATLPKNVFGENLTYQGRFRPADLRTLNGSWGLVWDGESLTTCQGSHGLGEYLRYNASHKLSLYLASGMPVIVWQESGVAAFVNQNHLGLTVNSLEELPERIGRLTENEKALISEGVGIMSEKIRHGEMLRNCLKN